MDGAIHALDTARDAGLRVALASSSPPKLIEAVLRSLAITDRFELTCSAAHEEHGKPHPAVFLTTARQLGVAPEHCVVLEDSLPGVDAGLAANMRVIAVPTAEDSTRAGFARADLVLGSLEELETSHLTG